MTHNKEQEKGEWISVKDGLPDIGRSQVLAVLALCGKVPYVLDFITDENSEGKFYLSISYPSRVFSDYTNFVTHWRALPPILTELPSDELSVEKQKQKQLLTEIMQEDEKDGLYQTTWEEIEKEYKEWFVADVTKLPTRMQVLEWFQSKFTPLLSELSQAREEIQRLKNQHGKV